MEDIKEVVEKVIEEVSKGKEKIFNIIDTLKNEYEKERQRLTEVSCEIKKITEERDTLEKLDKYLEKALAKLSEREDSSEEDVKKLYERVLDVRVRYTSKQIQENNLKNKRADIEEKLKIHMKNIEEADATIKQVNIALGYIKGDILEPVNELEENMDMDIGIKILKAQEKERSRIARDIHDGPAQYLANTVMRMDLCKKILCNDLQEGIKELEDLKENVKVALKEVRAILFDLRPLVLTELSLKDAIVDIIQDLQDEDGIICTLYYKDNSNIKVETMLQVAVYRIIQEITNNIKKHSKTDRALIRVEIGEEFIYFKVSDNGVGFDYREAVRLAKIQRNSYGLLSIIERVEQLQGEIEVVSKENIGTTYKIKLPILRGDYDDKNNDS